MILVKVRYKYGHKGQTPNSTANENISAEAKTESAVLAALKKRYPDRDITILSIS